MVSLLKICISFYFSFPTVFVVVLCVLTMSVSVDSRGRLPLRLGCSSDTDCTLDCREDVDIVLDYLLFFWYFKLNSTQTS